MDNIVPIKAPAISTVDKDGVQWTFDPAGQKWTASLEGKKFSSKDYSTVRSKMLAHRNEVKAEAAGKAPLVQAPPAIQTVDVGMLSIRLESSGGSAIDFTKEKIKVEPITAKIEWDTKKGVPAIVRYKEKEGGWRSFNSDSLILFHPNFMDASMRKFFERSLEGRMLRSAFEKAETQVANDWWNAKEETRETYSIGMHGFTKEAKSHYDRHSSRGAVVSSAWPLSIPENIDKPAFEEWKPQDNGSLKRGKVSVEMETTGNYSAQFHVRAEGYEEPIFSSADLRIALIIGNATHDMLSKPEQASVRTWSGTHEWTDNIRHNSWPRMMEVQWAVAMPQKDPHRSNYTPMTFVFGRFPGEKGEKGLGRHERNPHELGWHQSERYSYGGRSYRLAGPEDAMLDVMDGLRKKFDRLAENNDLVAVSRDNIREVFGSTLADLYNAAIDGEDEVPKDPAGAVNAFNNLTRTIKTKIEARGAVAKWQEECTLAVSEAKEALSGPPAKPSASRKPR